MSKAPDQFNGVSVVTKANVYFEGRVVSHTVLFSDGTRKTIGLIYPGKFHFGTDKAELMEIVAGECAVKIDQTNEVKNYGASTSFNVPAKSGFDIEVRQGICEYVCTFLEEI
jgi:uncharacterized protein YaiE (UPF0345 family)